MDVLDGKRDVISGFRCISNRSVYAFRLHTDRVRLWSMSHVGDRLGFLFRSAFCELLQFGHLRFFLYALHVVKSPAPCGYYLITVDQTCGKEINEHLKP